MKVINLNRIIVLSFSILSLLLVNNVSADDDSFSFGFGVIQGPNGTAMTNMQFGYTQNDYDNYNEYCRYYNDCPQFYSRPMPPTYYPPHGYRRPPPPPRGYYHPPPGYYHYGKKSPKYNRYYPPPPPRNKHYNKGYDQNYYNNKHGNQGQQGGGNKKEYNNQGGQRK